MYEERVATLRSIGFRYWHARLTALCEQKIISENCPEPDFWHYHVNKPDELPQEFKDIHVVLDRNNVWTDYDWRSYIHSSGDEKGRGIIAYVDDTIYYP